LFWMYRSFGNLWNGGANTVVVRHSVSTVVGQRKHNRSRRVFRSRLRTRGWRVWRSKLSWSSWFENALGLRRCRCRNCWNCWNCLWSDRDIVEGILVSAAAASVVAVVVGNRRWWCWWWFRRWSCCRWHVGIFVSACVSVSASRAVSRGSRGRRSRLRRCRRGSRLLRTCVCRVW
jgi:hypothetical protein